MDRISQVSLNTMRLLTDNQKITAQNLSNLNTVGFRRDVSANITSVYLQNPNGYEDRVFADRADSGVDTTPSNLINTDRPLDIAINGDGFFVVKNASGDKVLTRRGDISPRPDGKLQTGDGSVLQGGGADISIPPFEKIEIGQDGTVSYKPLGAETDTMVPAGRIDLVKVPASNVARGLDGYIRPKNGPIPQVDATVRVTNNALETSNVNAVESMVELIANQRAYEMQIKLIGTAKDLDNETSKLMRSSS